MTSLYNLIDDHTVMIYNGYYDDDYYNDNDDNRGDDDDDLDRYINMMIRAYKPRRGKMVKCKRVFH